LHFSEKNVVLKSKLGVVIIIEAPFKSKLFHFASKSLKTNTKNTLFGRAKLCQAWRSQAMNNHLKTINQIKL